MVLIIRAYMVAFCRHPRLPMLAWLRCHPRQMSRRTQRTWGPRSSCIRSLGFPGLWKKLQLPWGHS